MLASIIVMSMYPTIYFRIDCSSFNCVDFNTPTQYELGLAISVYMSENEVIICGMLHDSRSRFRETRKLCYG